MHSKKLNSYRPNGPYSLTAGMGMEREGLGISFFKYRCQNCGHEDKGCVPIALRHFLSIEHLVDNKDHKGYIEFYDEKGEELLEASIMQYNKKDYKDLDDKQDNRLGIISSIISRVFNYIKRGVLYGVRS